MFETIRKSLKNKLICESIKLKIKKIIVIKTNSDSFIAEEPQNNLMTRGLHLSQLLI